MLATVAVDDVARCIAFVRLVPSVLDLRLVSELSDLCRIHRNVDQLAYIVTKVAL